MNAAIQPRVIGLGVLFAMIGLIVLALSIGRGDTPRGMGDDPVGTGIPAERATGDRPSIVRPIAGGLSLALGAGLIGIGMNRWRRVRTP